jgi:hypothetical protein
MAVPPDDPLSRKMLDPNSKRIDIPDEDDRILHLVNKYGPDGRDT